MSNTDEFLQSKLNKEYKNELIASFRKHYNIPGNFIGGLIGQKRWLSKENAYIGLVLMNKISSLSENDNEYDWNRYRINQNSKRFQALSKISKAGNFWNSSRFKLLVYIFGERLAPFVKKAWEMIPSLMYQEGYHRRSFRGTGLDDIYFTRQLNFIINLIHENNYNFTLEEYAIYSNNITAWNFCFVYAAAIDSEEGQIKQLFLDTIYGRHKSAKPSREIIKAMLLSHDETCWIAVEKLLLSAQRQEGLRQTILECLDETSMGAMKHFIAVILHHKLTRFSSVVRAIDTWAGFGWEGEKETTVRRFLEFAQLFLSNPQEITNAIKSKDNAEVYMALWAQGVIDVSHCTTHLDQVLKGNYEKISLALYFITQVGLSTFSIKYAKTFLEHKDPVIMCQAVAMVNIPVFVNLLKDIEKKSLFKKLEVQLNHLPKKVTASKPRIFSWLTFSYGKELVLDLMINLLNLNYEKDIDRILPHFEDLAVRHREKVTSLILPEYSSYNYDETIKRPKLSTKKRDFAFSILKDRSETVRRAGIRALTNATLSDSEIQVFEELLTRKSADFRKSVLKLITRHDAKQVKDCASRLIKAGSEGQRLAGLDLLLWLKKNKTEYKDFITKKTVEFQSRPKISSKEEIILSGLLDEQNEILQYNAENGYGLFELTKIPVKAKLDLVSNHIFKESKLKNLGLSKSEKEINSTLSELGELVIDNRDFEYTFEDWQNKQVSDLMGNNFAPIKKDTKGMTAEEKFCNHPLPEIWRKWFTDSGLTDRDLLLISINAHIRSEGMGDKEFSTLHKKVSKHLYIPEIPKLSQFDWQNPVFTILKILNERYPYYKTIDYLSELTHEVFDSIDSSSLAYIKNIKSNWSHEIKTWRDQKIISNLWTKYSSYKKTMSKEQFREYWKLVQWWYLTGPRHPNLKKSYTPELYDYARAYQDKLIGADHLYWRILKPDAIEQLTRKVSGEQYDIKNEFDFLNEFLENCRNRILEVELIRGDSSTTMTHLAQKIKRLYGIENFVRLLRALGKDTLHRGYIYSWGDVVLNRKEVLSSLLKYCYPSKDCTQKNFNQAVKKANITDVRLCDASTYSPQWLSFVAEYLGWKGMESAVWWLHAHTNGHHSEQTESEIAKFSSVNITAFKDGAVDIDWFRESYKALGPQKWKKLYDSAKYISDGGGHKRGMLYADVILKKVKIKEISERIISKRNQDYLRVYGVIPLSKTNPIKDVLKRYQFLQNFKKESKQFGAQRQASESIAVRVAMENLARTAGYSDPVRLQWAMETKEAQEIIKNAPVIEFEDVQIMLNINEQGKSSIVAVKEGKKLKSIPSKYRKDKNLEKLKAFNKTLQEQYRRTRKSLEAAMVNGDHFTLEEIETLSSHPVVSPMLKKLVLVSQDSSGFWNNGTLITADGEISEPGKQLKLAHCVDLFETKQWPNYQHYCFEHKLVQPFKQIFRELYIPTSDELNEKSVSRRYAGHQVQPKKTVALLKGQGWTVDYDEGLQKVHHKQNIIARMFAMADWFSPADVEAPTLETIEFFNRENGDRLIFENVDNRVFSETMRDIDLVVSVAHVGEVDPEASFSSIQLRSVIVDETCRLFKLDNVGLSENHAKIKGELGEYSVHLGSGVCHKIAGSSLSIIPVHSQHRGRMFLPFIDDDPKTAEIVSKVLLLAKDNEIKDPTILRQL